MTDQDTQAAVYVTRHSFHSILDPFSAACFIGALATDLAYWRTAEMMWADMSAWLLAVGLLLGLLTVIAWLVDFFGNRLGRARASTWSYLIGGILILVVSFFNSLVHSRDAWTSVVPTGLILSAVAVVIILFVGWSRWASAYRDQTGVEQ